MSIRPGTPSLPFEVSRSLRPPRISVSPKRMVTVELTLVLVVSRRNSNSTELAGSVRKVRSATTCSLRNWSSRISGVTASLTPTSFCTETESPSPPETAAARISVPEKNSDVRPDCATRLGLARISFRELAVLAMFSE